MTLSDLQGVGVGHASLDEAELNAVLDAEEPLGHEQSADAAVTKCGVNGEATELGHEVRACTHFEFNGGSADDLSAFCVFGHKQQAVVRVDEPGELVFVVVSGTVIGAVTSEKDVANGDNIFRGGLAYGDHDCPSAGDAWSSGDASSRRTSRAQRSVMRAIWVCSCSAWAPSPTAPSPSRVAVY